MSRSVRRFGPRAEDLHPVVGLGDHADSRIHVDPGKGSQESPGRLRQIGPHLDDGYDLPIMRKGRFESRQGIRYSPPTLPPGRADHPDI